MKRLTLAILAGFLVTIVTCGSPGTSTEKSLPSGKEGTRSIQESKDPTGRPGWVRLTNGQLVRGRIHAADDRAVTIETQEDTQTYYKGYFAGYGYEKESSNVALSAAADEGSVKSSSPSSWYPRLSGRERMDQVELTFFDPHSWSGQGSCVGELAKPLEEIPELWLFSEAGGKLLLRDAKRWGYHLHAWPGDTLQRPVDQPGLELAMPKDGILDRIAFVSPAQEISSPDDPKRTSYAIPDVVVAKIKDLSGAEAALSSQLFAGGAPKETPGGTAWAFSLPRNDRQCWVYLFDGAKKHGKLILEAFAAYGDALLLPDLMIDMIAADGAAVGRVWLLPIPESLSADGPAPLPISILAGKDATVLATVPVPPRQTVVLPPKAPSTRANVDIHFYDVSKSIPETIVTAYGTGRPTKDVSIKTRALTQEEADVNLRIDLSSLPNDRFPAVAWLFYRRSFAWRDGGFLPHVQSISAPIAIEKKPTKAISNQGRIPHALPILFVGPDPAKSSENALLDSPVVGGMSNALLGDALAREAGLAFQALNTLGSIGVSAAEGQAPRAGGAGGATRSEKAGDSMVSNTYVYVTIPPHAAITSGGLPTGGGATGGQSFASFKWDPKNNGGVSPFLGSNQSWGQGMLGNYDVVDPSGKKYDRTGEAIYDPATGTASTPRDTSGRDVGFSDPFGTGAGFDPNGNFTYTAPGGGVVTIKKKRK